MTQSLDQLRAQQADIDAQIKAVKEAQQAARAAALKNITELVTQFEFKSTEVFPRKPYQKKPPVVVNAATAATEQTSAQAIEQNDAPF